MRHSSLASLTRTNVTSRDSGQPRCRIAACASASTCAQLSQWLGTRVILCRMIDLRDISAALHSGEYACLLFDVGPAREDFCESVLSAWASSSTRLTLLWQPGTGNACRLLWAAKRAPCRVIEYHTNHPSLTQSRSIGVAADVTASELLLNRLAASLVALSPALQNAAVEAILGRHLRMTVEEFGAISQVPRRTLDRSLRSAGFRSTKRFLDACRVAHEWNASPLMASCLSDSSITRCCRRLIGVSMREARRQLDTQSLVQHLVNFISSSLAAEKARVKHPDLALPSRRVDNHAGVLR